ncbi:MAG: peptide-methionine (S)-S-oxide reductase [Spirochaetaceae bacterium]|nr:MAG: peptide-methionine (S)-S-oxide reductase [Spirochaetaceae bacterium]
MPGVVRTRVGYAGGTTDNPTYYSIGDHSESIQIDYDPKLVSYAELLDVFWSAHNPRTSSFSRQYRSLIFVHNDRQRRLAVETKNKLKKGGTVYTDIVAFSEFYLAEDYHQKYYLRNTEKLMGELRPLYPQEEEFINSTAVARLNGYIGGFGTLDQLERELDSFGLSERAEHYLRGRISRR